MNFSIVHQISNRMRLRANKKLSRELAVFIADSIENIEGVFGVEVNPFTGSVLVFFENVKTQESVLLFFQKNIHSFDEKNAIQKPSMNPFLVFAFVRPLLPIFVRTTLSFFRSVPFDLVINLNISKRNDRERNTLYRFDIVNELTNFASQVEPMGAFHLLERMKRYWNTTPKRRIDINSWYGVISTLVNKINQRKKCTSTSTIMVFFNGWKIYKGKSCFCTIGISITGR